MKDDGDAIFIAVKAIPNAVQIMGNLSAFKVGGFTQWVVGYAFGDI